MGSCTNSLVRQLHPTQYGYVCPSETPEGKASGSLFLHFLRLTQKVTKAIAWMATFSKASPPDAVREILEFYEGGDDYVFVNGALLKPRVSGTVARQAIIRARRSSQLARLVCTR